MRSAGTRGGEAAEQPEGHRRKLIVGIGEIFHETDAGAEQRADDDAGEHKNENRIAGADRGADRIDRSDGNNAANKCEAPQSRICRARNRCRSRRRARRRRMRQANRARPADCGKDPERPCPQRPMPRRSAPRRARAVHGHARSRPPPRPERRACAPVSFAAMHADHIAGTNRITADRECNQQRNDQNGERGDLPGNG